MCKTREVTHELLKTLLNFNPTTGVFIWTRSRGRVKAGDVAGSFDKDGYIIIKINGITCKAHRLAWLYTYDKHPLSLIDHINKIKDDNRICNLREATYSQNNTNRGKQPNTSNLPKGVYYSKQIGRFVAQISVNGKNKHIASCLTAEEAGEKYRVECFKLQGEFAIL